MDIYFSSVIGQCNEFKPRQDTPVSIIISPLRVEGTEEKLKVITGCNMWRSCRNKNCFFSTASRSNEKIKARE